MNILDEHQEDVSRLFATKGADRFGQSAGGSASADRPILDDVLAYLDCTIEAEHDAGDHVIVVGRVLELGLTDGRRRLLYQGLRPLLHDGRSGAGGPIELARGDRPAQRIRPAAGVLGPRDPGNRSPVVVWNGEAPRAGWDTWRSRRIDMDVRMLGSAEVLGALGDVAHDREPHRRRRLVQVAVAPRLVAVCFYWRLLTGNPIRFGWPHLSIPRGLQEYLPGLILVLAAGRAP